jgi:hypothetical protein
MTGRVGVVDTVTVDKLTATPSSLLFPPHWGHVLFGHATLSNTVMFVANVPRFEALTTAVLIDRRSVLRLEQIWLTVLVIDMLVLIKALTGNIFWHV